MSIGLKANNDGSGVIQVSGTDRVTLSTAGVMSVPGGVTADVTGNMSGNATGSTFSFNSGYGSVATAYGCRAWVNFNGAGTVAIRASGNVSSVTDNGVGNYTVNLTTAMPDISFSALVTDGGISSGNKGGAHITGLTISSFTVVTYTSSAASYDSTFIFAAVFR
jgi:hypothetical protein